MKTIITFGTFDVFHIGHLRLLQRAKLEGTRLIVGVSSDTLNYSKKKRYPVYEEKSRMDIVNALECVDEVFLEESLELKPQYIHQYNADMLVMGDDWKSKFDDMPCEVKYLERTPTISTTTLIETIKRM
jgi:glycerol-3-phosphate cytidylyltransferase